jgi:hypothetical protein
MKSDSQCMIYESFTMMEMLKSWLILALITLVFADIVIRPRTTTTTKCPTTTTVRPTTTTTTTARPTTTTTTVAPYNPGSQCEKCPFGRRIAPISAQPALPGSIFEQRVHHNGIFVRSELEFNNTKNAYERVGIPFTYAGSSTTYTYYCGKWVYLVLEVWVSDLPYTDTHGFLEISWIKTDDDNFYYDMYLDRGAGLVYSALITNSSITHDQMLHAMEDQGFDRKFGYAFDLYGLTAYADFYRIGYVYVEVVTYPVFSRRVAVH